jgi:hypothetical protein
LRSRCPEIFRAECEWDGEGGVLRHLPSVGSHSFIPSVSAVIAPKLADLIPLAQADVFNGHTPRYENICFAGTDEHRPPVPRTLSSRARGAPVSDRAGGGFRQRCCRGGRWSRVRVGTRRSPRTSTAVPSPSCSWSAPAYRSPRCASPRRTRHPTPSQHPAKSKATPLNALQPNMPNTSQHPAKPVHTTPQRLPVLPGLVR